MNVNSTTVAVITSNETTMTTQISTQISTQINTLTAAEPISKQAKIESKAPTSTNFNNFTKENQEKNLTFMVLSISLLFMIG